MTNLNKKRTLQGKFYKSENGRETYEIYYAVPDIMFEIGSILVSKFGCSPLDPPFVGLDVIITKCKKENVEVDLGWDNWSGFYLLANSPEGDSLVREIGVYLDTIIEGTAFEKYIHYW
jgi:hypothetical protein